MKDDIELPPPRSRINTLGLYSAEEVRDAILADRQKREKPERKVRSTRLRLWPDGNCWMTGATAVGTLPDTSRIVTLKWDDKGAWIDSERNREIAVWLRAEAKAGYCGNMPMWMREAADALDGGHSS